MVRDARHGFGDKKPKHERDMKALETSVRFAVSSMRETADNLEALLEECLKSTGEGRD